MSGEFTPGRRPKDLRVESNALVAIGTTSEVHLARIDGSSPRYAAKVLRSIQEDDEDLFGREIGTYRIFEDEKPPHPNIVRFHGQERDAHNGHRFFVMDLASEGALKGTDDRVKRLPAPGVHRVVKEIGSALTSVHDLELVHNNVNPRDILMHKKGADRRNPTGPITFWLSDWGDATDLDSLKRKDPPLGGDPLYRAPEKFDGQVTKSTDLYSFGATIYELLTGKTPFDLPELSSAGRQLLLTDPAQRRLIEPDMAQKHTHEQVPLFSNRWDNAWLLDEKDTALRLAVEEDVHKALARYEENRQGSVAEFVANFSEHMTKAEEEQAKHKTTITAPGKIFLGTYPTEEPQTSSDQAAIRKLPQKDAPRPKKTKSSEPMDPDRRAFLFKAGGITAGVVLGIGYLGVSLKNGLSDGRRDRTSTNESTDEQPEGTPTNNETAKPTEQLTEDNLLTLAHEGITSFQQAEEIGFAGQIASFIGDKETARKGITDLQANEAYGYAGDIAARIGDTKTAREMLAKSRQTEGSSASGYTAALLDDKEIARQDIASLQNEGEYGAAGVIAALIGDEDTAVQAIQAEENLAYIGEIHALLNKPEDAAIIVAELNAMGQYRNVGRIAAILGDKEGVETAITNIQNADNRDPIAAMNPEGFAGYLAAEAIWWKKRREEQGL